jgi:hypothetical protein
VKRKVVTKHQVLLLKKFQHHATMISFYFMAPVPMNLKSESNDDKPGCFSDDKERRYSSASVRLESNSFALYFPA